MPAKKTRKGGRNRIDDDDCLGRRIAVTTVSAKEAKRQRIDVVAFEGWRELTPVCPQCEFPHSGRN